MESKKLKQFLNEKRFLKIVKHKTDDNNTPECIYKNTADMSCVSTTEYQNIFKYNYNMWNSLSFEQQKNIAEWWREVWDESWEKLENIDNYDYSIKDKELVEYITSAGYLINNNLKNKE